MNVKILLSEANFITMFHLKYKQRHIKVFRILRLRENESKQNLTFILFQKLYYASFSYLFNRLIGVVVGYVKHNP